MMSALESVRRIALAARMLGLDLARRRLALLLLFLVPALFDAVVLTTTSSRQVEVTLGSLVEEGAEIVTPERRPDVFDLELIDNGFRELDQRALSLVFLGHTAVCFLACFLAFFLVHKRRDVDARLVLTGYRPREVLAAKAVVLTSVVLVLALYQGAMLRAWMVPNDLFRVVGAFFLGGVVYGCFGLLIGALVAHELEGVFLIVLLANVDVGWLQNPIYYATSTRRVVIESLPGYGSAQLALVGAFADRTELSVLWASLAYAVTALVAALSVFGWRIRVARAESTRHARYRRYYAKVMLATYVAWLASFQLVGRYAATLPTVDLTMAVDRAIPVVAAFVWPYQLCYVLPFGAWLIMRDWHRFNVAIVAIALANLSAFAVYLALPIAFARPSLGEGLSEQLLALEYAGDFQPGANKLPSMHVAISWIIALALHRQHPRRIVDGLIAALVLAITAATVLVKQHLVIDSVAGVAWGLAAWWAARAIYPRLVDPEQEPDQALRQLCTPSAWRPWGREGR